MVCVFTISESPQPPPRTHRNRLHSLPNAVNSECLCMAFVWTCRLLLPPSDMSGFVLPGYLSLFITVGHNHAWRMKQTSMIQTQVLLLKYALNKHCLLVFNSDFCFIWRRWRITVVMNSKSLNQWSYLEYWFVRELIFIFSDEHCCAKSLCLSCKSTNS